jgi:hypothetical protein
MTDELDELLWQMWLDEHGKKDFNKHKTKIKQAIQALIADQMAEYQAQLLKDYKEDIATAVREARIDTLVDVQVRLMQLDSDKAKQRDLALDFVNAQLKEGVQE